MKKILISSIAFLCFTLFATGYLESAPGDMVYADKYPQDAVLINLSKKIVQIHRRGNDGRYTLQTTYRIISITDGNLNGIPTKVVRTKLNNNSYQDTFWTFKRNWSAVYFYKVWVKRVQ
ncbi:MAG TPA: hypothetical protein PLF29_03200 [bacterium]|nr:hypothetical protein [bacterium]